MTTMIRLEVLRVLRNGKLVFFSLIYPSLLYVIMSASTKDKVSGLGVSLYVMVSMASFGAVGATLTTTAQRIADERQRGWTRQLRLTALDPRGYVLAKMVATATVSMPAVLLVLLAGRFVEHVQLAGWQWLAIFGGLWLGSFVFAALGVALGYLSRPDTVQPIVMVVYLGGCALGGLWVPNEAFPGWLRVIGDALPTYRFSAVGWRIERGLAPAATDLLILVVYLLAFVGLAGWLYRRDARTS